MRKILLISNYVFHYRIAIYNHFYDEFKKLGYDFHVLSYEYQNAEFDCKFVKHVKPFSIIGYIKEVKRIDPDVVINFLHLKDKMIFPLTIYCRFKGIPMIYWNHGVNLGKAENKLLHAVYRLIHRLSNAVIIYTPNELKYVAPSARNKTFIAYNTLCFDGVDKKRIIDKTEVRRKYSINEDRIILFISRVVPYKNLDLLLDEFADEQDVAIVIVGPGISEQQMKVVNNVSHYYYLGEKYGDEVDEIYSMGDVYSTPGHIGLALIQAFFWGKPVVVLNVRHAPEIYYMKDGKNGFLVDDAQMLKEKVLYLLRNKDAYSKFSINAVKTVEGEANIARMFEGFQKAISYCISNKQN